MSTYDEHSLDKLALDEFRQKCEPIKDEVVSQLASMCNRLSHLKLCNMDRLSESGRISMAGLLR